MNSLKTVVVIAVLAIVGYGLYVGLNNGFQFQNLPPQTPEWLTQQLGPPPEAPNVDVGMPTATPGSPSGPRVRPGTPTTAPGLGEPNLATNGVAPPTASYPKATYPPATYSPVAGSGSQFQSPPTSSPPPSTTVGPQAATGFLPSLNPPTTPPPSGVAATAVLPLDSSPYPGGRATKTGAIPPAGDVDTLPDNSSPPQSVSDNIEPASSNSPFNFSAAVASARDQLNRGQLATALLKLSIWYEDPRLQPDQQAQLTDLLDQVAGSVIYSRKHLIEPGYRVRKGEGLSDIAKRYKVPTGLLAKINGIQNPDALTSGRELKVVRGPFNAIINSKKSELTLWVGGRYAGRFALTLGSEFENIVGPFVVQSKARPAIRNSQPRIQLGPGFGSGAGAAQNGNQLWIAGLVPGEPQRPGRIGVSPRDAGDLYDILSEGSKVTIRK